MLLVAPAVNQALLLQTTAPVLKLSVHDKGVVGHSPRYSRVNTMLEVEVTYFAAWCRKNIIKKNPSYELQELEVS